MTDPRRGLMRIISTEKVWRLGEVGETPMGWPPRLKIHKVVVQEFGPTQAKPVGSRPRRRMCMRIRVMALGWDQELLCRMEALRGPTHGASASMEVRAATLRVNGLLVASGCDGDRCRR